MEKTCSACGASKPLEAFNANPLGRDGRRSNCKDCQRAYTSEHYRRSPERRAQVAEWKAANRLSIADQRRRQRAADPEKARRNSRRYWLRFRYGMEPEEFDLLLERQGGGCAICHRMGQLRVDHDHDTGVVRGLLCHSCNVLIGLAAERVETLRGAADYLAR